MPIYKGSTKLGTIYIGGTKIKKVYKGSTLVYTSDQGFEMIGVFDPSIVSSTGIYGCTYKNSSVGDPVFQAGIMMPGYPVWILNTINGNIGVPGSTISASYLNPFNGSPTAYQYNHVYSTTRTIFGKLYYQYDYVDSSGYGGRSMIFLSPKQKVGDYIFGSTGDLNNPNADFNCKITSITSNTVTFISGNRSYTYTLDINNSYGNNGTAIYRS